MIAVDTSVLIPWLARVTYPETIRLDMASTPGDAALPAVVITELLSDPRGAGSLDAALLDFPQLPITEGYWERAGLLRAKVRQSGRKAALGDALIAQACIDADVPLLTRDTDFQAYVALAGLKLA